jgi:RNA polymerase sigma factor (sigma-70 family)
MRGEPEDQTLASAVAAGDGAAEETFAQRFRKRLVDLARLRGVPVDYCEDVADEAILTAIGQLRRGLFRGDSSVTTWLDKILHGKAADFWRRLPQGGRPAALDEGEDGASGHKGAALEPIQSNQVERLMVREVLARMPAKHRRVLLLNQSDGYTTKEIARLLGWSPGAVGRVLAEAKAMFRKLVLGGEEPGDGTRQKE